MVTQITNKLLRGVALWLPGRWWRKRPDVDPELEAAIRAALHAAADPIEPSPGGLGRIRARIRTAHRKDTHARPRPDVPP